MNGRGPTLVSRAALVALAWAAAACGGAPPALGVVLPLTGPLGYEGREVLAGIELALADAGRGDVELLVRDGRGDPARTASLVDELARQGAVAVVGPVAADGVAGAAAAARAAGIPLALPAGPGRMPGSANGWVFRLGFSTEDAARALADWARYTLDLTRLAIVVDLSRSESVELAQAFASEFVRRRGLVVTELSYFGGVDDGALQVIARRLADLDVEGVFAPGLAPDVAALVDGLPGDDPIPLVLLGGPGWDEDGLRQRLAGRLKGAYHVSHFAPDEPGASTAFARAFTARHGRAPTGWSALGYDTARVVLSALDRGAGPEDVRAHLALLRGFDGVSGQITMDLTGRPALKKLVLEQAHDPRLPRFVARLPR